MIIKTIRFIKDKNKDSQCDIEYEMQLLTSDDVHRIRRLLLNKEYQNILVDGKEYNLVVGLPTDIISHIHAICDYTEKYPSGPPSSEEIMIELYTLRHKIHDFSRKVEDFDWKLQNLD